MVVLPSEDGVSARVPTQCQVRSQISNVPVPVQIVASRDDFAERGSVSRSTLIATDALDLSRGWAARTAPAGHRPALLWLRLRRKFPRTLMSEENPTTQKKDHWFKDWLIYGASSWLGGLPIIVIIIVLVVLTLPSFYKAEQKLQRQVVIYTSQDQVYAEPILKEFERQTGMKVRAVFDSESVKTVGLVNRLIAEKDRPQCDLFWNNEELRTRQLAAMGVFEKWVAVGHRSRRITVNTN